MMAGDMEKLYGKWTGLTTGINDGLQGGPIILFSPSGDTLIISQMSQFMATSMQHNKYAGGYLNYGIMSGVNEIPENFSVDFMVYYSDKGINKVCIRCNCPSLLGFNLKFTWIGDGGMGQSFAQVLPKGFVISTKRFHQQLFVVLDRQWGVLLLANRAGQKLPGHIN